MHGFLSSVLLQYGRDHLARLTSPVHRTAHSACQPELFTGGNAPVQLCGSLAVRIECSEYLRRRGLGWILLWAVRIPSSRL